MDRLQAKQQRYGSVCERKSIVCVSAVHSSLVEVIFRHLGLAQSYKSTCTCPKYLYLHYSVEFTLLQYLEVSWSMKALNYSHKCS